MSIRGTSNNLIENCLANQTIQTFVNNAMSDNKIIRRWVPQGSILGPVLYLLYSFCRHKTRT